MYVFGYYSILFLHNLLFSLPNKNTVKYNQTRNNQSNYEPKLKKNPQKKKNQVGGSGGIIKEANGLEKLKEINREERKKENDFFFFFFFHFLCVSVKTI
jgi:hypothetical protein